MVERNTQALHIAIPCISKKCYTTYMLRHLLFKIHVTIIWGNTVLTNVVTMIMHVVRCTPGDLAQQDLFVIEWSWNTHTHTRDEHCNVLLTVVPVRFKHIPLHRNMCYIILVLILTLMYLQQSLHNTVTHKLGMWIVHGLYRHQPLKIKVHS